MGKDIDEAASGFGNVFRDRLTYLMNGNNVYGKPVNTQELADEIDISRPAVRKYIKPNDRREVTVPSALVVSRIARFFHTTPNFLLGFDAEIGSEDAQRAARATCITPSASVRRPSMGCTGCVRRLSRSPGPPSCCVCSTSSSAATRTRRISCCKYDFRHPRPGIFRPGVFRPHNINKNNRNSTPAQVDLNAKKAYDVV